MCVDGWLDDDRIFLLPAYQHFNVCEMRVVWCFCIACLVGKS